MPDNKNQNQNQGQRKNQNPNQDVEREQQGNDRQGNLGDNGGRQQQGNRGNRDMNKDSTDIEKQDRTLAILCTAFGLLAVLLTAVGIYGVIAWTVARRTSEIAVRMALGARPQRVLRLVMREVVLLAAIGIARARPPNCFTFRVPVSWSTMPATRNKAPLYSAWASRNSTAPLTASVVPIPSSITSTPRALIVE